MYTWGVVLTVCTRNVSRLPLWGLGCGWITLLRVRMAFGVSLIGLLEYCIWLHCFSFFLMFLRLSSCKSSSLIRGHRWLSILVIAQVSRRAALVLHLRGGWCLLVRFCCFALVTVSHVTITVYCCNDCAVCIFCPIWQQARNTAITLGFM